MITVKHTSPNSPLKPKVRKFDDEKAAIDYVDAFRHNYGCSWPFEVNVGEFKFEAKRYSMEWYVVGPSEGLNARDIKQCFELKKFVEEHRKGA